MVDSLEYIYLHLHFLTFISVNEILVILAITKEGQIKEQWGGLV